MPNANPQDNLEFVTALARGLAILRVLNDEGRPLTLAEAARLTGLPRAAARRSLHTLQGTGYVQFDGRTYRPTVETLRLGAGWINSQPISEVARPVLADLSAQLGESCSVSILSGALITYVARVSTSRLMSINLQVGTQLPAYCTSMGRVLLAHLPEAELDAYLQGTPLLPHTPHTLTDPQQLRAELRKVAQQGYALIDQELELGLRSVAVPVFNQRGEVKASLNTGASAAHRSVGELVEFVPQLQSAAARLTPLEYLNH